MFGWRHPKPWSIPGSKTTKTPAAIASMKPWCLGWKPVSHEVDDIWRLEGLGRSWKTFRSQVVVGEITLQVANIVWEFGGPLAVGTALQRQHVSSARSASSFCQKCYSIEGLIGDDSLNCLQSSAPDPCVPDLRWLLFVILPRAKVSEGQGGLMKLWPMNVGRKDPWFCQYRSKKGTSGEVEASWDISTQFNTCTADEKIVTEVCFTPRSSESHCRRSCMKLMAWSLTAPERPSATLGEPTWEEREEPDHIRTLGFSGSVGSWFMLIQRLNCPEKWESGHRFARAQVRDAFMALDTGSTGTIRISDLKQILEESRPWEWVDGFGFTILPLWDVQMISDS